MTGEGLLLAALATPLVAVVLVLLLGRWPDLREAASLLAGAVLTACCLALAGTLGEGAAPALRLLEPLPGLALELRLEPFGAAFACLASFLWLCTTVYAIGYLRSHGEQQQTRFYACFALALHAVMGIATAGNLLTLFFFYELLTLSTYPLVTHAGTPEARRGGRLYLGILLGTSIGLFLPALVATQVLAGRLDFVPGGILGEPLAAGRVSATGLLVLFTLFGLGIGKAALLPVHRWLPAAMVAPTPVSALLHAVAVVKAGVFTVLKVAVYVFGLDTLADTGAATAVAWLAGVGMVLASLVALRCDDLKERLAWSTIGQLAYITAGVATATSAGVLGAGLHMLAHGFAKITLFFAAGTVIVAAHRTGIRSMAGLGRTMPFTFVAFTIGSLGIVGLPPLGGMWSKWWLGQGLAQAERPWLLGLWLLSSLLSACYLLPVAFRAFRPAPGTDQGPPPDYHGEPLGCRIAMAIAAGGSLLLFVVLEPALRLLWPAVMP